VGEHHAGQRALHQFGHESFGAELDQLRSLGDEVHLSTGRVWRTPNARVEAALVGDFALIEVVAVLRNGTETTLMGTTVSRCVRM